MIKFEKYHGTGNDFIMIDNREKQVSAESLTSVSSWCDRRFGIGADGVILIERHSECDFNMTYYNSDGTQSFCGNGSRCAVIFARSLGIIENETRFMAIDGMHEARIDEEDRVHLKMADVSDIETHDEYFFINTGSPHYIKYVSDLEDVDVVEEARAIRYSARFEKEGTNVNFVGVGKDRLMVRTYERGVEDETLSCGTGVTAVALSAAGDEFGKYEALIQTLGGTLEVAYDKIDENNYVNIFLIGPGEKVFEGMIDE